MTQLPDLATVSHTLFSTIALGDTRRERRFHKVVQAMAESPGASLPQVFPDPSQYNAALNLFASDSCTHAVLLDSHRQATYARLDSLREPVLLLHDATLLDFSGHRTLKKDLGPIGNGGGTGWIAHQTLAVDPRSRLVHGLLSQILHVRKTPPRNETVTQKRQRSSRESRLWIHGLEAVGPTPAGCQRIDIADRGADIFEFLQVLLDGGRRFVIRSYQSRALGDNSSEAPAVALLRPFLRSLPTQANWQMEVPAEDGKPARVVRLQAAASQVTLRPPHVKKGTYRAEPMELFGIRVWEEDAPRGVEAVEWFLLSNEEIRGEEGLKRVVDWYACRMLIEEYHKVQKSGMGVEKPQVQSVKKLEPIVAVLSVLSVALLNLRQGARDPELAEQPAEKVVPGLWVDILNSYRKKRPARSVKEFWTDLARLGGYQKNPEKHPPGWITLWRGWSILQHLIRYQIARDEIP